MSRAIALPEATAAAAEESNQYTSGQLHGIMDTVALRDATAAAAAAEEEDQYTLGQLHGRGQSDKISHIPYRYPA